MKHFLVTLLALCWATAAFAQSFPKPPDVPAYVAPATNANGSLYNAGTTPNVIGDGSATGGAAPADAYELAESSPSSGAEISANIFPGPFTLCETAFTGGACAEAKFRTTIGNDVSVRRDDPIRNYSQPGTSHCHTFFGNKSINAFTTYALSRSHRDTSQATGKPLNATGYWFPCNEKLNPFANGKNYVMKPTGDVIVYYAQNPPESMKTHRLLLGLRYVGGYNMDFGGTVANKDASHSQYMQNLIDIANAQPGTSSTRYQLCNVSDCHVFAHWTCTQATDGLGQATSNFFKNGDGSDPWNGHCKSGDDFWVQFSGPRCWDGINLWSPGGYKHVIPEIYDSVNGVFTCPNGWYLLPALQLQIHFRQHGFSDYGTWVLSCDAMAGTNRGGCFHTDWLNGWNRAELTNWLISCIAIGHEGATIPHECSGSTTATTEQLKNEGPVTTSDDQVAADMIELPAAAAGSPTTLHTHCSTTTSPAC